MTPLLANGRLLPFDKMPRRDVEALLDVARSLAANGQAHRSLRGKNIGLLCENTESPDAALFQSAATALGAHVSRIKPSLALLDTPEQIQHTARMLGRLYDAVECQGLRADLVQQIEREAGVPVFDALAGASAPADQLASLLDGFAAAEDKRRYLVQALLISSLS